MRPKYERGTGNAGGLLTERQYAMLVEANGCSLPGDGLRIRGAGQHRVAESLFMLGLVRVAKSPGSKARVHVTVEGRACRERIGQALLA